VSDDLMQFLRARLDEDAAVARKAASRQQGGGDWTFADMAVRAGDDAPVVRHTWVDEGAHIARHDPTRVLAEVDAKRELIDEVLGYEARIDGEWGVGGGVSPNTVPALRLLARPFRDHPDFDPSWLEG
jgi:hypothetical protein